MAIKRIGVDEFLVLAKQHPLLDVRSPGEFDHAHIPNAHSLPLFSDEERKVVGTVYKQESREKAIKIGLKFFGKQMVQMVEDVEKIVDSWQLAVGSKTVLVHCWRGGMRSAGVAWLLDLYGFKVYSLAGGYKAYRNWVLDQFTKEYNIKIIGGYTGSAKTYVLQELKQLGESVIDIEGLAHHKGSAFGNIGMPKQPSQEMFENLFAQQLSSIDQQASTIWMEDESQRIGDLNIPSLFFKYMRTKPVLFLDIQFEERLNHIVAEYGKLEKEKLVNAIMRIQKRLGGVETKNAINHLIEGNIKDSFHILLKYYDKWYEKSLRSRENWEALVSKHSCNTCDSVANAKALQSITKSQKEKING
jgi:tRNA 2-selenouridine synthase